MRFEKKENEYYEKIYNSYRDDDSISANKNYEHNRNNRYKFRNIGHSSYSSSGIYRKRPNRQDELAYMGDIRSISYVLNRLDREQEEVKPMIKVRAGTISMVIGVIMLIIGILGAIGII